MPMWKLKAYIDRMNPLRSERQLLLIQATAFPHMDDRGRGNTLRAHNRVISPAPAGGLPATQADLAKLGIPVVQVAVAKES